MIQLVLFLYQMLEILKFHSNTVDNQFGLEYRPEYQLSEQCFDFIKQELNSCLFHGPNRYVIGLIHLASIGSFISLLLALYYGNHFYYYELNYFMIFISIVLLVVCGLAKHFYVHNCVEMVGKKLDIVTKHLTKDFSGTKFQIDCNAKEYTVVVYQTDMLKITHYMPYSLIP